ncbi:MFS general substrate transporter [Wallemia mellicola]|uniref:MFS general substrate transporter n=1 Tax=Wallemia mellicola TaxID=1708541 RepID=A0AB38MPN1_9BASI|nr:MFS general substrate transporter [Wallemia mellicola]
MAANFSQNAQGTELWAPWSEEFGRWPILQGSLFLVNVWSLMSALSPNFGTVIVARFLGGISSAGGVIDRETLGITLGMISDLWKSNDHQWGLCFVSWTSLGGPVLGAIIGGFIEDYSNTWRWTMWVQLIFGGALQVIHFFLVPETRTSTMLNSEAKRRRKAATKEGRECRIVGPTEKMSGGPSLRNVLVIWSRPFEMFLFEPIVLCCSLLSGFSDMLIFIFLESYGPVYEQWNFTPWKIGLAFMPIMISYCISWASYLPWFYKEKNMRKKGNLVKPEFRLYWLLWTVPLEPIGLFGFAWSSLGPARNVHWIAPMIFSFCVGVANYSIFMATIDFMIQAYGPYSASATGGNAFARNLLAGISAMFSAPFYEHFKEPYTLEYPTTILACIGVAVAIPVYFLYIYQGPIIRHKSRFAQTLAHERETLELRHQVRDEKKNIEHRENV